MVVNLKDGCVCIQFNSIRSITLRKTKSIIYENIVLFIVIHNFRFLRIQINDLNIHILMATSMV